LAKGRFATTNWLVILGIFVTILIFAIQTLGSKQNTLSQQNIQIQNSQLSESEKK
jgi:hypothetical protein